MQRAALLVLAALALPARAHDGFVDPLDEPSARSAIPARRLLNAVAAAGGRLVAAGQRGHIVLSDDHGKTWKQAEVQVSTDLTGLSFPTAQKGWAVGHDGVILATRDGGETWTRQLDGRRIQAGLPLEQISLLDVFFDDEKSGTAVGAFGLILRTEDGGASWSSSVDPKGLHLYAVRRVGGALFIAGEQGLVLRLDGDRFVPCKVPYQGSFFGLTGTPDAVLAFGLRGNLWRSSDRGESWQKVETGLEVALTGGTRAGGRILLTSAAGQVLFSGDGGSTFSLLKVRPAPTSTIAVDGSSAVLVGMLGARVEELSR